MKNMTKTCFLLVYILFNHSTITCQNLIKNSDFELCTPLASLGGYSENPGIDNWERTGFIDIHSNSIVSLMDGKLMGGFGLQHIDLNGALGSIEQTVSNLKIGQSYTFSYYTSISVHVVKTEWIQRAAFSIIDGNNKIMAADSWTLGFGDRTKWVKHSYKFTAESGTVKVKFFSILGSSTNQHGVLVDSVSLATENTIAKKTFKICLNDTIKINNKNYSKSGLYLDTLKKQNGNDSFIAVEIITETDYKLCSKKAYYIPNAFSPNNDDFNSVFKIYGEGILNIHMQIFNRWGEKIFESLDAENGWDGSYKNQICEQDVYLYIIDIKTKDYKVDHLSGSFTLIK